MLLLLHLIEPLYICLLPLNSVTLCTEGWLLLLLQVLKGHDDHVITCLEFCGNKIVSGSDDNTLKVWSAVNGKVASFLPSPLLSVSRCSVLLATEEDTHTYEVSVAIF